MDLARVRDILGSENTGDQGAPRRRKRFPIRTVQRAKIRVAGNPADRPSELADSPDVRELLTGDMAPVASRKQPSPSADIFR